MSQLTDPRQVKKVTLSSYPSDFVEMYDGLLTYQLNSLTDIKEDYARGIESLRLMIKTWSFVDAEGKQLPVTAANLGLLPTQDFTLLMNTVSETFETMNTKKKKS